MLEPDWKSTVSLPPTTETWALLRMTVPWEPLTRSQLPPVLYRLAKSLDEPSSHIVSPPPTTEACALFRPTAPLEPFTASQAPPVL